jgi:nucleotide-binding universal stress UspA family protein
MKKILVTTDFSAASKAGLRFAIQLATQMDVELVFFHCFQALIPTTIHRERIKKAMDEQGDVAMQKLEHFVVQVHKSMKVAAGKHRCVVVEHLDPEKAIIAYAQDHDFQFICMCTHGAGTLRKIMGTHTGTVLHRSTVPVLVVPHNYRVRPIKKLLYSSDLANIDKEMAIVSTFAEILQVKTDLAHFYYFEEISLAPGNLKQMWRLKYPALDRVYLQPYDVDKGFPAQLDGLITKSKPSLVVFFTHINRTWFDKLFSVSISESVSFVTKVPMLVYRKKT